MGFNNGPADREPNPHAVVLGGIEGLEEAIRSVRGESNTGILHGELDVLAIVVFRFD